MTNEQNWTVLFGVELLENICAQLADMQTALNNFCQTTEKHQAELIRLTKQQS